MNYRTCYGCTVDGSTCPARAAMRDALKGLGITSIAFKCAARQPAFYEGQRVTVTWPFYEDEEDPLEIEFHATVIYERKPGRYRIRVDDGPDQTIGEYVSPDSLKSGGHAHVSVTRLQPLDELTRTVCAVCGRVEGLTEDCYGYGPEYRDGGFIPLGCIKKPTEPVA